jgi:hypothetical protein
MTGWIASNALQSLPFFISLAREGNHVPQPTCFFLLYALSKTLAHLHVSGCPAQKDRPFPKPNDKLGFHCGVVDAQAGMRYRSYRIKIAYPSQVDP